MYAHAKPWRGDSRWHIAKLTGVTIKSLGVAIHGGRLPGMTMRSHGTVLSLHGDLLVPRPTFLISMVTCCKKARYDW